MSYGKSVSTTELIIATLSLLVTIYIHVFLI